MGLSIHSAQASSKAFCDTRLHNCVCGVRTISTAIEMVHLEIACCIRPALRFLHDMASTPTSVLRDWFVAGGTQAVLPSPDTVKLATTSRRVQHLLAPPGLEILFPLRVMRVGGGLNLDVPLYWRVRFLQQGELALRAILLFFGGGKYPFPGPFGLKVFLLNPSSAFMRVPSYRPSP
jgi:hypothetical protein